MRFGHALTIVMARKRVSPVELARRIGRSRSYVSQLMSGNIKEPKLSAAFLIADALDVPLQTFVDLMHDKEH